MARLNIEDRLFRDGRYTDLCIKFGCRFKALGAIAALWILGQEYWKRDRSLIPKHKWKEQNLPNELIEVGFVFERDHGFEVDGAEKNFSWLIQKVEAGKKGGSSKNSDLEESGDERGETDGNESKPPTPTPTLSPVPSITPYSPPEGEEDFKKAFNQLQTGIEKHTNIRIVAGSNAKKRFLEYIIKPKKLDSFLEAIVGYLAMLEHEQDRTPKKSLETFIGTKRSGFYWDQWVEWKPPETGKRRSGTQKTFAQQTWDENKQAAMELEAMKSGNN